MSDLVTDLKNFARKMPGLRKSARSIYSLIRGASYRSPFTPGYFDYMRQRPLVFAAWFRLRKAWWDIRNNSAVSTMQPVEFENILGKAHLTERVIPHNINRIGGVARARTEKLMNVLRSVGGLDKKNAKVLCIGPRNEAEILLLSLYGFSIRNIMGIDLFSYSPLIRIMDMHDLRFADNHFDVIYSSHVVSYSHDIRKACAEMVRVTKDFGLIAIGFVCGRDNETLSTRLWGGLDELFGYFDSHIRHVYWQEEIKLESGARRATTVFSICK